MPDLSTVCLPLSPQPPSTAAGAGGELAGEQPAAAAVTTAAVAVSASAEAEAAGEAESASGGDGAPVLPVECRWSGRVRSFAGAGEGAGAAAVPACPAPRRGGGKKPSSAPSPSSTVATAPAHPSGRPFEEYVKEWKAKKAALGVPAGRCELPFLTGAPKAQKIPQISLLKASNALNMAVWSVSKRCFFGVVDGVQLQHIQNVHHGQ
uniref:Uncharacterized protein n=1 Tax=Oryza nivara TaxID=4536 RepID=A0A0E0G9R8_ORYNI